MKHTQKEKIRYLYRPLKEGFLMDKVRCPTCKSNHINGFKIVQDKNSWDGKIILLAECWSGNINNENPRHLFLIELEDLPITTIRKVKR